MKSINGGTGNDILVPINIYFKMNSLDPTQTDNQYIDLNQVTTSVKHVKKLKFLLENESENRAFVFTVQFSLNRANIISKKSVPSTPTNTN